jgi:hypothetical protein
MLKICLRRAETTLVVSCHERGPRVPWREYKTL